MMCEKNTFEAVCRSKHQEFSQDSDIFDTDVINVKRR